MRDMRGNRNMALKNLVNQKATMDDTKMLQISHLKEYPDKYSEKLLKDANIKLRKFSIIFRIYGKRRA